MTLKSQAMSLSPLKSFLGGVFPCPKGLIEGRLYAVQTVKALEPLIVISLVKFTLFTITYDHMKLCFPGL